MTAVLGLAPVPPEATVVDVGCGNGRYLAAMRARGHTGPLLGLDASPGMAAIAAVHGNGVAADAQRLPLATAAADLGLAMHMLYHVPDPMAALRELRRVVRPGGTVLVSTNGRGHVRELNELVEAAGQEVLGHPVEPVWVRSRFDVDDAGARLAEVFDEVDLHEYHGQADVPAVEPVMAYLASVPPSWLGLATAQRWAALLDACARLAAERIRSTGSFPVTSRVGVFVCR